MPKLKKTNIHNLQKTPCEHTTESLGNIKYAEVKKAENGKFYMTEFIECTQCGKEGRVVYEMLFIQFKKEPKITPNDGKGRWF